jgi:tRNA(Ile)-lysidine synthase
MDNTIKTACPIEQAVLFWHARYGHLPWVLGYSGGMDSMVLMHVLSRLNITFTAVHIHHGLQPQADAWLAHCRNQAQLLGVPFKVIHVSVSSVTRRGLEDRAREARYDALWSVLASGCLITAHHQRDQAETFLMRALRGAGLKGLSAMSSVRQHSEQQWLLRPLLTVSYAMLTDYAQRHHLSWIEDPTNDDVQLWRNHIRHHVLPQCHPQGVDVASQRLAHAAQVAAEGHQLLTIMAQEDWHRLTEGASVSFSVGEWRRMPWIRAKNMLQWRWYDLGGEALTHAQWQIIEQQFYRELDDESHAQFSWHGLNLLADKAQLWLLRDDALQVPSQQAFACHTWGAWGRFDIEGKLPEGLDNAQWRWCSRKGGESIEATDGKHRLKKWLQDAQLPYWQRQRWPVLYDAKGEVIGWANMPKAWWPWAMNVTLTSVLN